MLLIWHGMTLVEHCEYGELKEEMICNRIMVGIREKLQLDSELALEQKEAVRKHQQLRQAKELLWKQ